jgi:GTPase involved in cell partitioning and DNA repair
LGKKILGVFFILLSLLIVSVTAIVYESAEQAVTQTVKNIATLTLTTPALGNIEEGETKSLTKTDIPALGDAITITTTKADVYLHLNSDVNTLSTYYTAYTITVKYATVQGVSHSTGDIAATISIASPDPTAINLDAAGTWTFDFEISATAKSVSSDQATTATIVVTAESS